MVRFHSTHNLKPQQPQRPKKQSTNLRFQCPYCESKITFKHNLKTQLKAKHAEEYSTTDLSQILPFEHQIQKSKNFPCGKCDKCLLADCGTCNSCVDKNEIGGNGTLRKRFVNRFAQFEENLKQELSIAKFTGKMQQKVW